MALPKLYTAPEAAQYLRCDYRQVLKLINEQSLFARRQGNKFLIPETSLAAYVNGETQIRTGKPRRLARAA